MIMIIFMICNGMILDIMMQSEYLHNNESLLMDEDLVMINNIPILSADNR